MKIAKQDVSWTNSFKTLTWLLQLAIFQQADASILAYANQQQNISLLSG